MVTVTFHRDVYMPNLRLPSGCLPLRYSSHALTAAEHDKLEKLPSELDTTTATAIEVTTDNRLAPVKLLYRMTLRAGWDLCVVVAKKLFGWEVVTVWTNRSDDLHRTLDRSRYVPAPSPVCED